MQACVARLSALFLFAREAVRLSVRIRSRAGILPLPVPLLRQHLRNWEGNTVALEHLPRVMACAAELQRV